MFILGCKDNELFLFLQESLEIITLTFQSFLFSPIEDFYHQVTQVTIHARGTPRKRLPYPEQPLFLRN